MLQKIKTFTAALAITTFSLTAQAQLKTPAPSPLQSIKQNFALSEIGIEYSRPSAKGRVIFGDVVPFGKIWRTGANSATKITFGEDVKVEGQNVAAGTYALYSIPNKDNWELMLYKDLALGGNTGEYKKENELMRFSVKPSSLTEKVETFEINVANISSSSSNIELRWENTRVSFNVVADIDTKIMKNIEKNVINDSRPYYQAASYYYENNKDLKLALEWADKAASQNPKAYWVLLLKAKIQAKSNDKKGAAATAAQVVTLAKEDQDDAYVKMAEQIIADSKK
jgi:hypothetical protein